VVRQITKITPYRLTGKRDLSPSITKRNTSVQEGNFKRDSLLELAREVHRSLVVTDVRKVEYIYELRF